MVRRPEAGIVAAHHVPDALEQERTARHTGRSGQRRAQETTTAAHHLLRGLLWGGLLPGTARRRRRWCSAPRSDPRCIAEEAGRRGCLGLRLELVDAGLRRLERLLLHQDGLREQVRRARLRRDETGDQPLRLGIALLRFIFLETAEKTLDEVAFLVLHDGASSSPPTFLGRAPSRWLSLPSASRGSGLERTEPKPPRCNLARAQQVLDAPDVRRQPRFDLGLVRSAHHQQHIARAGERTAQQHEPIGHEAVHVVGVGAPLLLLLHRTIVVPTRSARVDDGKQILAHDGYTRVKSMIQLVSQLAPASVEKACYQRADSSVIRDHTNLMRIARPSCSSSPWKVPMPLAKRPTTGAKVCAGRRLSNQWIAQRCL